jgi:hypothetical protein
MWDWNSWSPRRCSGGLHFRRRTGERPVNVRERVVRLRGNCLRQAVPRRLLRMLQQRLLPRRRSPKNCILDCGCNRAVVCAGFRGSAEFPDRWSTVLTCSKAAAEPPHSKGSRCLAAYRGPRERRDTTPRRCNRCVRVLLARGLAPVLGWRREKQLWELLWRSETLRSSRYCAGSRPNRRRCCWET